jgi:hypothetical protein
VLIFLYQIIGELSFCVCNIYTDTLYQSFMIIIIAKLKVLQIRLRELSAQEFEFDERLKKCVKYHNSIVAEAKACEKLMNIPIFMHYAMVAVIMAFTGFFIVKVNRRIVAESDKFN